MDAMNGAAGFISIALNLVILVSQLMQAKSVAELKVYMHENFIHKKGDKNNG